LQTGDGPYLRRTQCPKRQQDTGLLKLKTGDGLGDLTSKQERWCQQSHGSIDEAADDQPGQLTAVGRCIRIEMSATSAATPGDNRPLQKWGKTSGGPKTLLDVPQTVPPTVWDQLPNPSTLPGSQSSEEVKEVISLLCGSGPARLCVSKSVMPSSCRSTAYQRSIPIARNRGP
jgi:hypothetical protein